MSQQKLGSPETAADYAHKRPEPAKYRITLIRFFRKVTASGRGPNYDITSASLNLGPSRPAQSPDKRIELLSCDILIYTEMD